MTATPKKRNNTKMSVVIPSVEVAAPGLTGGSKACATVVVYLRPDKEQEKEEVAVVGRRNGFWKHEEVEEDEGSLENSSIGVGCESSLSSSSSTEEEDPSGGDDEAESKPKQDSFRSLDSLEEALPIKRGLSNFFSGKSKSFACLSDVANGSAKDLAKSENPFNKRRRILTASKNSWRTASYSSLNTSLPPLLSPDHAVAEEEEEREDGNLSFPLAPLSQDDHEGNVKEAFKKPRSFSLSDLQHA